MSAARLGSIRSNRRDSRSEVEDVAEEVARVVCVWPAVRITRQRFWAQVRSMLERTPRGRGPLRGLGDKYPGSKKDPGETNTLLLRKGFRG